MKLAHMTPEDQQFFRTLLAESEVRMTARQDRAIETIAGEMSALRTELGKRIDNLSQRLDNLAPVIISVDARMAGFTRAMDQLITENTQINGTQAAQ